MLGQVLRRIRKERSMTQEDVAFKCGVDRSYLSYIERGLHQPSVAVLFKIARALDISPSTILAEVEKEIQKK